MCPTPPTSSNSVITVHWNYTHTGGLKLTQVIVTAYMGILANIQLDVPNGNLTDLSQMSLDIATFTAGFQYTFQVTAYNQFGSSTAQCDPVMHLIGMSLWLSASACGFSIVNTYHFPPGIPHVPDTPTGVSRSSGSVVLTLRTPASGRMPSSEMFSFIVNFTQPNSIEGSRTLEASDYIDGQNHQFTIDGLMEGEQYVFSAQAQNQFGYSKFSGNSDFITINGEEDLQPSKSMDDFNDIIEANIIALCFVFFLFVLFEVSHTPSGKKQLLKCKWPNQLVLAVYIQIIKHNRLAICKEWKPSYIQ